MNFSEWLNLDYGGKLNFLSKVLNNEAEWNIASSDNDFINQMKDMFGQVLRNNMKHIRISLILKDNNNINNLIEKVAEFCNLKIGEIKKERDKDTERIIIEEIYRDY